MAPPRAIARDDRAGASPAPTIYVKDASYASWYSRGVPLRSPLRRWFLYTSFSIVPGFLGCQIMLSAIPELPHHHLQKLYACHQVTIPLQTRNLYERERSEHYSVAELYENV